MSTSICGANERVNYMAPTKLQHDLANANEVSAMSIVTGASTYGVRTPVRTKWLVRDVCTEWRSAGDNGHADIWTSVPMIDRKSLCHSNVSETLLDV